MSQGPALLDSSTWIEILGSGPLEKPARAALEAASTVIVPTIVIFEVYRKIASQISEDQALSAVAALKQYSVADLTGEIALNAADLSVRYRLGMANSFILAHAENADALLVTLDNDFAHCPGVKIIR